MYLIKMPIIIKTNFIFIILIIFANNIFSSEINFLDVTLNNKKNLPQFKSLCLKCHKNITSLDKNHDFHCITCHNGNNKIENKEKAHKNIIKNPSDLKFASEKCGKCHKEDINNVKNSIMSTGNGIINITRFLWNEQKSPLKKFSTVNTDDTKKIGNNKLVDNFLRKVCLRCHINTEGSKRFGEIRNSGCAACHVLYKNNGKHNHKFTSKIPTAQCLHCHNFNRIGMDYVGYFEHDYSRTYRSPIYKNGWPPKIYGIYQHRLQEDIHFQKGMDCIDCHNKNEIMGNDKSVNFKYEQTKIKCVTCHLTKKYIITKISNKKLTISQFNPNSVSHQKHKNLECYTCHSAWGFQDYGLNILREDYKGYFKWKFLKDTNIPDTQEILYKSLGNYGDISKLEAGKKNFSAKLEEPITTDYISNKKTLGVYYIGWIYRRWEEPVIGINQRGKISPVRPDYQFYVSWIDKNLNIKLDNKKMKFNWSPYVPHTISKYGRSCFSCHKNLKTLGLGYGMISSKEEIENTFEFYKDGLQINFPLEKIINIKGKKLQDFVYPGASPLQINLIKKLLLNSSF